MTEREFDEDHFNKYAEGDVDESPWQADLNDSRTVAATQTSDHTLTSYGLTSTDELLAQLRSEAPNAKPDGLHRAPGAPVDGQLTGTALAAAEKPQPSEKPQASSEKPQAASEKPQAALEKPRTADNTHPADKPNPEQKPVGDKPTDKPVDKPAVPQDKTAEAVAQKPAEAKPQPGRPAERTLESGGREVRAIDSLGHETVLRTNSSGVPIYCRDQSGEWTSENGRQWSGPRGRTWSGRVEMRGDGTLVSTSEGGTVTTQRPDGSRRYDYSNRASFTETPTADGGMQSTLRNPQGQEFSIRINRDGIPTSVTDDSGTWTSRDGRNWERDNGAGRERSTWRGTVRMTPNGDYETTSESGRVVTQGRDGVRTTVMPDRVRMVERNGMIDMYDRNGRHEGTFVAADQTHSVSGMQAESEGGTVINQSGRPLLVMATLGSGDNKSVRYYVLPPGQSTPAGTDADGIITDPRFQPRYAPDGRLLVPANIPPSAEARKIVNGITATVTDADGSLSTSTSAATWGARFGQIIKGGALQVGDMTGGGPMMPHRRDNADTVPSSEQARVRDEYNRRRHQEFVNSRRYYHP